MTLFFVNKMRVRNIVKKYRGIKRGTAAECLLNFHRFAGFKCVLITCFGECKGYVHLFWKKSMEMERYRFFCDVVAVNFRHDS